MKELTIQEKEQLKEKIEEEQAEKREKERQLIAHREQSAQPGRMGLGTFFGRFFSAIFGGRSYSDRLQTLRATGGNKAEDDAPLRRMELTDAEKEALKKKIENEKEKRS